MSRYDESISTMWPEPDGVPAAGVYRDELQYHESTSASFQQQQQLEEEQTMETTHETTPAWIEDRTPELNAAFAAARAEMRQPELDGVNPHFGSRYASLASVINATVPILAKHGIVVTQDIVSETGGIICFTTLLHDSGQVRRSRGLFIAANKMDAQGMISASTYARRVQLATVCCVAGEPDDDANRAASGGTEYVTDEEIEHLENLVKAVEANRDAFLRACQVQSFESLPRNKLAGAIARLEAKRKPKRKPKEEGNATG